MNTVLINLLIPIIKQLVGGVLFAFIANAVNKAEQSADPGDQKRATVIRSVMSTSVAQQTAGWLINLAIEAAVAKLKTTK